MQKRFPPTGTDRRSSSDHLKDLLRVWSHRRPRFGNTCQRGAQKVDLPLDNSKFHFLPSRPPPLFFRSVIAILRNHFLIPTECCVFASRASIFSPRLENDSYRPRCPKTELDRGVMAVAPPSRHRGKSC
jgi:hypothetical protein